MSLKPSGLGVFNEVVEASIETIIYQRIREAIAKN